MLLHRGVIGLSGFSDMTRQRDGRKLLEGQLN